MQHHISANETSAETPSRLPDPAKKPQPPGPYDFNGRKFFARHEFEYYKRRLIDWANGIDTPAPEPPDVISFVSANKAADELDYSRRTLDRKLAGMPRRGDGSCVPKGVRALAARDAGGVD